jgi:hypothetical protein
MTLTLQDIERAQKLYNDLEVIHRHRDLVLEAEDAFSISAFIKGTAGRSPVNISFQTLSDEGTKELRALIRRDLRNQAAKIVAELHKMGCEAVLSPKDDA